MSKKKSWIIKGIPVLALAGVIALNLLVFPKILAAVGNADEGEVVEIVRDGSEIANEEVTDDIYQNQTENEEEKEISNDGRILDSDMYSVKIEGTKVKGIQKEGGVIWVVVDPDTANKVNGNEKINNNNLGILVVKPEKNGEQPLSAIFLFYPEYILGTVKI